MKPLSDAMRATMTPREIWDYGLRRTHWFATRHLEGRRPKLKPDKWAAPGATVLDRDKAALREQRRRQRQQELFTPPKSDPAAAAKALEDFQKFKETLL